jgi:hypothetical protein
MYRGRYSFQSRPPIPELNASPLWHISVGLTAASVLLARGQALPRLHPLDGGGLGVADRPPDAE